MFERCVLREHHLIGRNLPTLLIEIAGNRLPEPRMTDMMHRAGGFWRIAARQLVFALRSRLHRLELAVERRLSGISNEQAKLISSQDVFAAEQTLSQAKKMIALDRH